MKVPRPQRDSKTVIFMAFVTCWIIAIVVGTVPLYFYNEDSKTCYLQDILRWEYIIFRFIVVVAVPLIVMGFVYFKIYRLIREQVRMIKRLVHMIVGSQMWRDTSRSHQSLTMSIFSFNLIFHSYRYKRE